MIAGTLPPDSQSSRFRAWWDEKSKRQKTVTKPTDMRHPVHLVGGVCPRTSGATLVVAVDAEVAFPASASSGISAGDSVTGSASGADVRTTYPI